MEVGPEFVDIKLLDRKILENKYQGLTASLSDYFPPAFHISQERSIFASLKVWPMPEMEHRLGLYQLSEPNHDPNNGS